MLGQGKMLGMKEILVWRHTLLMMVQRDIKLRISGTSLGFAWLLMQPLFLLAVYSFVFSGILNISFRPGASDGDFALYLFAALVPFSALQEAVTRCSTSLLDNRELLLKSQLPMWIFPLVLAFSSVLTEMLGLLVLFLALLFFSYDVTWHYLFIPLLVVMRLLMTLVIVPLVAIFSVYFRDLVQIVPLFMTAWFFATPIIYPMSMIPEQWQAYMLLNPMSMLVDGYRAVLLENRVPENFVMGFIVLLPLLVGSWYVFIRLQRRARDFL